ncbi:MAG TPA: helix-turn-helix transcriptional regulator [Steroidobacteraceae bacterium]|jgi:DNA-binding CsgD family transcriptional regulator|nr:helix-turn-helix transcriptional regulator [Steroidobacteraceae bacterium]
MIRGISPRSLDPLAETLDHVGAPDFYRRLMTGLGTRLRADLGMVMRYSRHHAPEYLIHERLQPEHMALYLEGLYRVDPIYRLCRRSGGRGIKDLAAISSAAERSGDYFRIFLRLTGMADDLAVLLPTDGASCVGIVFERRRAFRPREISEMRVLFPLIESMHRLHRRLDGLRGGEVDGAAKAGLLPLDYKAALDGFLAGQLTPRERDIVRLALMGYPSVRVAEKLGLSINTVKNHRKRIYSKLDITTERELFLNFVGFLSGTK